MGEEACADVCAEMAEGEEGVMPRCDMCQHWTTIRRHPDYGYLEFSAEPDEDWAWYEERHKPVTRHWGVCEMQSTVSGKADHAETLAVGMDSENYKGYTLTAPDFYCAMWRAKDGQEVDEAKEGA